MEYFTHPATIRDYLARMSIVRPADPILTSAQKLGLQVTLYEPAKAPWSKLGYALLQVQTGLFIIAVIAFYVAKQRSRFERSASAGAILAALISWPFFYGRTGIRLLDFGLPANSFLSTLHLVDIFFIRDPLEVQSWSFSRFYCQLLAFPDEDATSRYPRWENFKGLGLCLVKMLVVNILLYAAPPPHLLTQVESAFAYIGYNAVVGAIILFTLGFVIEGALLVNGIVWGVQSHSMFNNPLMSSNLRSFWANWNLAIKDGLHRISFRANKAQKKASKKLNATNKKIEQRRFRHKDNLSETDISSDEASAANAERPKAAEAHKAGTNVPGNLSKKRWGGFISKAGAATLTFAVSGAFHEYMNHIAFDGATGETMLFFLAHAFGTIFYVWLSRTAPSVREATPEWLGITIVVLFACATSPLFCMPFVRVGFFEDLKAAGIAGPVRGFIWIFGH